MKKEDAIKYLQQLYPNGGHCWLDEQRIEAIDMAVKALQEEPVSEELEEAAFDYAEACKYDGGEKLLCVEHFKAGAKWGMNQAKVEIQSQSMSLANGCPKEPVSEDLEDVQQTIIYNGEVYTRCYKDKLDAFACKYPMSVPKTSKKYAKYSDVDLTIAVKEGAKWQAEQFEKNRLTDCDRQTEEEAEIERDFCMGIIENEHRQPTFDDAIKYGMKLREQQMMAKAIDGHATFEFYGLDSKTYGTIAHDPICFEDFDIKDSDKVKMVLIKED